MEEKIQKIIDVIFVLIILGGGYIAYRILGG